ncbi:MAG: sulfotransferase [Anaerolineae bacterium]|nr:sulfotransferase [Anaerolineae bacterium]
MTITDYLNQSGDTLCFHEPNPFLNQEALDYHIGRLSQSDAVQVLCETRSTMIDGKHYGESNLNLSLLIPALHDAFPEARFLWLIRDGRDTVASFFARNWHNPLMGPQHRRDMAARQWELSRPRGDQVGEMSWWEWNRLSPFEKCCWHWAYINQLIEEKLTVCDCKWKQIRLEDLNEKGSALFDFLGIAPPEQAVVKTLNKANRNLGQNPVNWQNWSPEQIRAFRQFCIVPMDNWYPEWRDKLATEWVKPLEEHPKLTRSVRLLRIVTHSVIRFSVVQTSRVNDKYHSLIHRQRRFSKRIRRKLRQMYQQLRGFQG